MPLSIKISLREHCMCLQAEEVTILAQTQVQELEDHDQDNPSVNELS